MSEVAAGMCAELRTEVEQIHDRLTRAFRACELGGSQRQQACVLDAMETSRRLEAQLASLADRYDPTISNEEWLHG
jgi:hypothetical protein